MNNSNPGSADSSPANILIDFDCIHCKTRLKVGQQLAGRNVKCPKCLNVVTVPGESPVDRMPIPSNSGESVAEHPNTPAATDPASVLDDSYQAAAAGNVSDKEGDGVGGIGEVTQTLVDDASNRVTSTEQGKQTPTRQLFERIAAEVRKVFVGQEDLVLGSLVALFSGGHVLIESVPGLGKTLFVRTLGKVLGCQFGRIQFTADLMPSDITGAPIFNMKTQEFVFKPGPVFTQLLLADEINRSPAKTHASLLEIMQEKRVTIDGTTHRLALPFLVMATQNPIESEGTYNLPEAQLDRFMFKLKVDYPSAEQEAAILMMHGGQTDVALRLDDDIQQVTNPAEILDITRQTESVRIDPLLVDYINKIVRLTRHWPQFYMGASPRAGIALMQGARTLAAFRGREFAVPDDVVEIALPVLRHRVVLTAEAEVEGLTVDRLLVDLMRTIEVPRLRQ